MQEFRLAGQEDSPTTSPRHSVEEVFSFSPVSHVSLHNIFLWDRLRELNEPDRIDLLNQLREMVLIRRRRGRFYDLSDNDDDDEPPRSGGLCDGDVDFRTYPLSINWYKIENDEKDYFAVLGKFGYFGVSLYSTFETKKEMKMTLESFLQSLLEYFATLFRKGSGDKESLLSAFICGLPAPQKIRDIIHKRKFMFKEVGVILIVLRILEVYYRKYEVPNYQVLVDYVFRSEADLTEMLKDEEWKTVYEEMKAAKKIESTLQSLGEKMYRKRKHYIAHLNKLKRKFVMLGKGIKVNEFII